MTNAYQRLHKKFIQFHQKFYVGKIPKSVNTPKLVIIIISLQIQKTTVYLLYTVKLLKKQSINNIRTSSKKYRKVFIK